MVRKFVIEIDGLDTSYTDDKLKDFLNLIPDTLKNSFLARRYIGTDICKKLCGMSVKTVKEQASI